MIICATSRLLGMLGQSPAPHIILCSILMAHCVLLYSLQVSMVAPNVPSGLGNVMSEASQLGPFDGYTLPQWASCPNGLLGSALAI